MYEIRHNGKVVEHHTTLAAAERAFWVLTAHELMNGRVADVMLNRRTEESVRRPAFCEPPLPDWAVEVLGLHGYGEAKE